MQSAITIQPLATTSTLTTNLEIPGDKSLSHRAAIFAGLAQGTSRITNFLAAEDCLSTLNIMQELGAKVTNFEQQGATASFEIIGTSGELQAPTKNLDCGNAGTAMRLLSGVLAGQNFSSTLVGDASLSSRPMSRVILPLQQMGATCQAVDDSFPPLTIQGGNLTAINYLMPIASAQVKSAILLAGLFTAGTTTVQQNHLTRDHTERLLADFQVEVVTKNQGLTVSIVGKQPLTAADIIVPGDISSASFWLVASALHPHARVTLKNVGLNPTRDAIIRVLKRMGADITIHHSASQNQQTEPLGDIEIRSSALQGTTLLIDEIPNLIDEIPILAIAGALSQGEMKIRNAAELRVKESDRIACVVKNLTKMGVSVTEFDDGMHIQGGNQLQGAQLTSYGDHRIAMAFAIAGLYAQSTTTIADVACIQTSYPTFQQHLQQFQNSTP